MHLRNLDEYLMTYPLNRCAEEPFSIDKASFYEKSKKKKMLR